MALSCHESQPSLACHVSQTHQLHTLNFILISTEPFLRVPVCWARMGQGCSHSGELQLGLINRLKNISVLETWCIIAGMRCGCSTYTLFTHYKCATIYLSPKLSEILTKLAASWQICNISDSWKWKPCSAAQLQPGEVSLAEAAVLVLASGTEAGNVSDH